MSTVRTKGLLHSYCNPINNVCAHNSQADSILVTPRAEMTDWQVVEGHLSRASCSPGAQVMVRPHPQVLLAAPGPQQRQAHWGATSPHLHGDEASEGPFATQPRTFMVSASKSQRSPPLPSQPSHASRRLPNPLAPRQHPPLPNHPFALSSLFFFFFFCTVFYGASASTRAANMSGPPCPGSTGPARPAGNSGEMLD